MSLYSLWQSNTIKILIIKFRSIMFIFYAIGALLAPILVRSFLKPFIFSYRQFYNVPNKEFLDTFLVTPSISTSTSQMQKHITTKKFHTNKLFKTTTRESTSPSKLTTDKILIIDFLRLDEDSGDGLYRLFERYFNYVYYIITGFNAIMVIVYSVFFLVESKLLLSKEKEQEKSSDSIEMLKPAVSIISKVETTSRIEKSWSFSEKIKNIFENLTNSSILISNKPDRKTSKSKNNLINIFILFLLILFYSLIYASFKLQSNYLLSYSIQPEYHPRHYNPNVHEDYVDELKNFYNSTTSLNQLFSFKLQYNFLSSNLLTGSYLLLIFYAGNIIGILLDLLILSVTKLNSIYLLYFNTLFYAFIQLVTISMVTAVFSYDSISETVKNIIWFLIQFFNGFFLSSIPALFCHHFSMKSDDEVREGQGWYFIKIKCLTFCEIFGLSIGAAVFQWLIPFLNELYNNFNSFINILFVNSILILLILQIIHISFVFINKRKSFVSPN
jgi:hypothetical protein